MSKTWAWHSPEDRITSQASTFPQAMGIPNSIPTGTVLGRFRYLGLCGETGVLEPITRREAALHYRGDVSGAVLIDRGNGPAHRLGVEPAKDLSSADIEDEFHMRGPVRYDDNGQGCRIEDRRDFQAFGGQPQPVTRTGRYVNNRSLHGRRPRSTYGLSGRGGRQGVWHSAKPFHWW